jgi:hypothetical protein
MGSSIPPRSTRVLWLAGRAAGTPVSQLILPGAWTPMQKPPAGGLALSPHENRKFQGPGKGAARRLRLNWNGIQCGSPRGNVVFCRIHHDGRFSSGQAVRLAWRQPGQWLRQRYLLHLGSHAINQATNPSGLALLFSIGRQTASQQWIQSIAPPLPGQQSKFGPWGYIDEMIPVFDMRRERHVHP